MPLNGPAKTAYQREYMRRRRSNKRGQAFPVRPPILGVVTEEKMRPLMVIDVRPTSRQGPLNEAGAIPKQLTRRKVPKMGFEAGVSAWAVDADGNPIPEGE